MSKLSDQWLELFRTGDYGPKGKFTDSDLQQIVANYDPTYHEAPVVLGHPEHDSPAYGWVDRLRAAGGVLYGKLRPDVDPKFEDAVQAGRFKKRSVKLYLDNMYGYSLRHVGFLGAMVPEVKGLANATFHDELHDSMVEIEFAQENPMATETAAPFDEKSFLDKIKALFTESAKPATAALPATTAPQFDEAKVKSILDAALAPVLAKNAELEAKFGEQSSAAITATQKARVDSSISKLKAAGKWVPAFDEMGLPAVFGELAKSTTTIEFGEGDKKVQQPVLDTLVTFLEGLGKIVPAGVTFDGKKPASANGVKFTESRARADSNSVRLTEEANRLVAADPKLTFGEALDRASAAHPELTVPGGASSGAV